MIILLSKQLYLPYGVYKRSRGDQASEQVIYMSSLAVIHSPDESFDKFRRQCTGELDGTIFLVWRNRRQLFLDSYFLLEMANIFVCSILRVFKINFCQIQWISVAICIIWLCVVTSPVLY